MQDTQIATRVATHDGASVQTQTLEERLPLVIRIIPGQSANGLVRLFKPGEYENKSVRDLTNIMLTENLPIEKKRMAEMVSNQLRNGKLLYNGFEASSSIKRYLVPSETRQGEKYLLASFHALSPEEGGLFR